MSVDPVTAYEKPITNFNRYVYARNNPYKFTDPDGRDSYLASRPLDNPALGLIYSHNYVVSHADYVGDPNAIVFSYGRTTEGRTGRVDSSTRGMSEGTAAKDREHWLSLAGDDKAAAANTKPIDASDARVAQVARALIENTPYEPVPGPHATNSNAAASAVASKAEGRPVSANGGRRVSEGESQRERIRFRKIQRKEK